MKIVSLVPHATKLLFALGLGDDVVAVTHKCGVSPDAARTLPHVTRDVLPTGLDAAGIDAVAAPTRARRSTRSIYNLLRSLKPDLMVTQELCAVCAVSYDDVRKVADTITSQAKVIALDPTTLRETFGDVRTIAQATGVRGHRAGPSSRASGRASTACGPRSAGPSLCSTADGVRSVHLRGRALDAAAHRVRRRARRARAPGRALRAEHVGARRHYGRPLPFDELMARSGNGPIATCRSENSSHSFGKNLDWHPLVVKPTMLNWLPHSWVSPTLL